MQCLVIIAVSSNNSPVHTLCARVMFQVVMCQKYGVRTNQICIIFHFYCDPFKDFLLTSNSSTSIYPSFPPLLLFRGLILTSKSNHRCNREVTSLSFNQRIRIQMPKGSFPCLRFPLTYNTNVRKVRPPVFLDTMRPS